MDKWEIPNLQTIRYIKSNKLEAAYYKVGLDPVATSYLVGWIKGAPTSLARTYLTT